MMGVVVALHTQNSIINRSSTQGQFVVDRGQESGTHKYSSTNYYMAYRPKRRIDQIEESMNSSTYNQPTDRERKMVGYGFPKGP